MNEIRFRTHAKLNLFLHVMGPRPDGYHEVETILHGVRLADDITLTPLAEPSVEVDMRLAAGLGGDVCAQEDNLAYIAARALMNGGAVGSGVRIDISKHIPVGAGLGGGSGNAAGTLVMLDAMWGLDLDRPRLLELAAVIGSDVPYCIDGGTALATARGEQLTAIPGPDDVWFVLGVSREPLGTGAVYAAWDDLGVPAEVDSASMTTALAAGDVSEIASLLHNDLEPVAFDLRPELAPKKAALIDAGSLGASLSGSGPTLFGVAAGEDHARTIAARAEGVFDEVLVVRSQPVCIERLD